MTIVLTPWEQTELMRYVRFDGMKKEGKISQERLDVEFQSLSEKVRNVIVRNSRISFVVEE